MNNNDAINAIRSAAENNNLLKVEFFRDGSGCYFFIKNNVTNDTRGISLSWEDTAKALAGFRMQQHEFIHCM